MKVLEKTLGKMPIAQRGFVSVLAVVALLATAQAQSTEVLSLSTGGALGTGGVSLFPSISDTGRYVAFQSFATNLVSGDTNAVNDIFVRDRQTGTTERVSVSSAGLQSNGPSYVASISAGGRYVVFESVATNLVSGDTNGFRDVFLHDRQTGTTERVSVSSSGVEGNNMSFNASVSDDGRFVAFESEASNLVTGDTAGYLDVFVRDRQTGTTQRASVSTGGVQALGNSENPRISENGRYVVFQSTALNLVTGDTNLMSDIFIRDLQSNTTARLSVSSGGVEGDNDSLSPSISADGHYVAFESLATNLVTGDTNSASDIFVRDRVAGTTVRASLSSSGIQGNNDSVACSISPNGLRVAFESIASNLVSGDTNLARDVFVRDSQSNTTERVSVSSSGAQANDISGAPSISFFGTLVAFHSQATNLVPGVTVGFNEIFVRDRFGSGFVGFCPGDGTGTPCPCGNNSSLGQGRGCLNSFGTGALLTASGTASASADTVTLHVSETSPTGQAPTFFQGTAQSNGGAGVAFADGLRCAVGTVLRLGTRPSVNGAVSFGFGIPGDPLVSVQGQIGTGGTRYYQVLYRNAATFCTSATFNLSNGLTIRWGP